MAYARDDIPENIKPFTLFTLPDLEFFKQYPDWLNAAAGNNVITDHSNMEYSVLGHLQYGSVAVQKGEKVKQGQQIGCLGDSGKFGCSSPALSFDDGPELLMHDGLPSRFENLKLLGWGTRIILLTWALHCCEMTFGRARISSCGSLLRKDRVSIQPTDFLVWLCTREQRGGGDRNASVETLVFFECQPCPRILVFHR